MSYKNTKATIKYEKDTNERLRMLKLSGIRHSWIERTKEARENNLSYGQFLQLLLEDEQTTREDNRRKRLYRAAKMPFEKHISDFDFSFQPSIPKQDILELSTGSFMTKGENVIFMGPPGTGKTHLAVSLGYKALSMGLMVLFTTVWDMITTLQQSRADHTYVRKIKYYLKPDLLILDELGYKSMAETTVEDFFEIISKRYEKKSIIVTSNRSIKNWNKIFIDKTLTTAIVDRLIHHCHTS